MPMEKQPHELWVDKYRPTTVEEMHWPKMVNKLMDWLSSNWSLGGGEERSNPSTLLSAAASTSSVPRTLAAGLRKRGCLLSGPPGVGKTLSVHVTARELNLEVVELNASDDCSESKVLDTFESLSQGQCQLRRDGAGVVKAKNGRPVLLLMDDVDTWNSSGLRALMQLLKTTKVPIVCTCNDPSNVKLSALRMQLEGVPFVRPFLTQSFAKYLVERILSKEGLCEQDDSAAERAIDGWLIQQQRMEPSIWDYRNLIGSLQFWCLTNGEISLSASSSAAIRAEGERQGPAEGLPDTGSFQRELHFLSPETELTRKDKSLTVFDAAQTVLSSASDSGWGIERLGTLRRSVDFLDLYVQENYLDFANSIATDNAESSMAMVAAAADCISIGDLFAPQTSLYPELDLSIAAGEALLNAIIPSRLVQRSAKTSGAYPTTAMGLEPRRAPSIPRIRFPTWFGRQSTEKRNHQRLQQAARQGGQTTTLRVDDRMEGTRTEEQRGIEPTERIVGWNGASVDDLVLDYLPLGVAPKLLLPLCQSSTSHPGAEWGSTKSAKMSETESRELTASVRLVTRHARAYHLNVREDWDWIEELVRFNTRSSASSPSSSSATTSASPSASRALGDSKVVPPAVKSALMRQCTW